MLTEYQEFWLIRDPVSKKLYAELEEGHEYSQADLQQIVDLMKLREEEYGPRTEDKGS